jgi:hypothetical protein
MMSLHSSMHSSQIKTDGPAMSFFTSCWLLPQKEQYRTFSPEAPFFSAMELRRVEVRQAVRLDDSACPAHGLQQKCGQIGAFPQALEKSFQPRRSSTLSISP